MATSPVSFHASPCAPARYERAKGGAAVRKRRSEIALYYTRFKFSVAAYKFPIPSQKFPVLMSREFRCKPLSLLACRLSKSHLAGESDEIPC
jgi:hypothetical protein